MEIIRLDEKLYQKIYTSFGVMYIPDGLPYPKYKMNQLVKIKGFDGYEGRYIVTNCDYDTCSNTALKTYKSETYLYNIEGFDGDNLYACIDRIPEEFIEEVEEDNETDKNT